jgi:hypothetical protein
MAIGVLAVGVLVRDGGWRLADAILCAASFTLAWLCWGVAFLLLPAVFTAAYFYGSRESDRRAVRALLLTGSVGLFGVSLLLFVFKVAAQSVETDSFRAWLALSGHGVPLELSLFSIARASLGFGIGFVHVGSFGRSVKGLLLGDPSIVSSGAIASGIALLFPVGVALLMSVIGLRRRLLEDRRRTRAFVSTVLATLIPVALFAALWQGSDVERMSLSLAMVAIAMVHGISAVAVPKVRLAFRWELLLAAFICLANLGTFVVPRLVRGGGMNMRLGREATQHHHPGDLIVVTGQELWGPVETATRYFWGITVFNVHYNVSVYGSADWDVRLVGVVNETLERGGKVAVLSDLVGRPTPSGIALSPREYPLPSLAEVESLFEEWVETGSWVVGPYTFLKLEPPGSR